MLVNINIPIKLNTILLYSAKTAKVKGIDIIIDKMNNGIYIDKKDAKFCESRYPKVLRIAIRFLPSLIIIIITIKTINTTISNTMHITNISIELTV
jgi:hypothetical protein